MFDSKQTLTDRIVDAADLMIDFSTLGEYGLEPEEQGSRPCEARHRIGTPRSTGAWNAAIARFTPQHS